MNINHYERYLKKGGNGGEQNFKKDSKNVLSNDTIVSQLPKLTIFLTEKHIYVCNT